MRIARWVWQRVAALVAVALILLALYVGYWVGGSGASGSAHETAPSGESTGGRVQYYTCSMHPSVRLTDPKAKCPICFMDLIPVADDRGAGPESERRLVLTESAIKLADVETTVVAKFFPTVETRLYAKLMEDETRVARISAYFSGRLESLHTDYVGVPVRKGEHVAEIYSPELLATFAELRQARLAVDQQTSGSALIRETTQQTLEAAREKLRLFGLTPEQIDTVEHADHTADTFTIYSPIGGVVTHLAVREGDYVQTGSPIATVADLSRLWLLAEAYESDLPLLRWGQAVSFTVASLPGETFEGRISFIEPMVDDRTRTATVRVAVDNADGRLKPGMLATAIARTKVGAGGVVLEHEFAGEWVCPMHPEVVKSGPGACDICGMPLVRAETLGADGQAPSPAEPVVVPKSAVLITGARAVVYVRVADAEKPTFEGREIVLGPRAGDFYVVVSGLSEGERVVTNGAFKIDSAMQIAAKPSMMSPGGAASAPAHRHGSAGGALQDATAPSLMTLADVPAHFLSSLAPVYDAYLTAQQALADDDLDAFKRASTDLNTALTLVNTAGVAGDDLSEWRTAASRLRLDLQPGDIADARSSFNRMSGAVIGLLHRFGHRGSAWYLVHCPMAFDFKGADWVQTTDAVRNPYFGATMLTCGTVKAEFAPADGAQEEGASHE